MTIQECINELEAVKLEIKRNSDSTKRLRARATQLEEEIKDYLDSKQQQGLKYKDQRITLENTVKRPRKAQKKKTEEMIQWFKERGFVDPERACMEIKDLQQGNEIETTRIRVKKEKSKAFGY
jgi:hypothetical protein